MDQADFLIIIALLLPLVYVYPKTLIIETLFRFYAQAWSENVVKFMSKSFWRCKLGTVWTWTLCLAIFQGNIVAQSIWRPQITTVQQPIDYNTRKNLYQPSGVLAKVLRRTQNIGHLLNLDFFKTSLQRIMSIHNFSVHCLECWW